MKTTNRETRCLCTAMFAVLFAGCSLFQGGDLCDAPASGCPSLKVGINKQDPDCEASGVSVNGLNLPCMTFAGVPWTQAWENLANYSLRSLGETSLSNPMAFETMFPEVCSHPGSPTVLSYLVACALDEGVTVTFCDGGTVLEGQFNWAPEWQGGGLSDVGKLNVSACLAMNANSEGKNVPFLAKLDETTTVGAPAGNWVPEAAFMAQLFPTNPGEHYIYTFDRGVPASFAKSSGRDCVLQDENCGMGTSEATCMPRSNGPGLACTITGDPPFSTRTLETSIAITSIDPNRTGN